MPLKMIVLKSNDMLSGWKKFMYQHCPFIDPFFKWVCYIYIGKKDCELRVSWKKTYIFLSCSSIHLGGNMMGLSQVLQTVYYFKYNLDIISRSDRKVDKDKIFWSCANLKCYPDLIGRCIFRCNSDNLQRERVC